MKKLRRFIAILLSSIFLFAGCSKKAIVKNINGVKMFPASVYKDLGYKLEQCPSCHNIFYITKGDTKVILTLNSGYIFVNKNGYIEKTNIIKKDGEIYIPVTALKELPDGRRIMKLIGK
ncbi:MULTISPECIES: hypothetical protein [Thermoanaerobacterium]|uniref:Lipoprotein n=3 Tax=Thermoanaerobacterium TaxID=28895 RepID=L0IQW6_THETR|nr:MULTISPECIES: hypothetical protein [Thermoanaerobacterium]AFK94325.1 hypothetical protein Tsac_2778 [Thermoanaerobacterium saccharolyticum JW/SL-YS485]AGB20362.1 hypothetical protein Thethe_02809 [Thermoanaerobacterium thermosaccharolyticum M0795]ETO39095.1 hypothetical protein V518_0683 [Thermoanaerobacterium aotearoense SCUT27]